MEKIRTRCQVCDGVVVNGRCRLCGMPYRNDEALYHLNENKEVHYRHASENAKKIMRENQVPLGDKQAAAPARSAKTTAAEKKNTSSYRRSSTAGERQKNTYGSSSAGKEAGKKKKTKRAWIFWLIIILLLNAGPAFSAVANFFEENFSTVIETFVDR